MLLDRSAQLILLSDCEGSVILQTWCTDTWSEIGHEDRSRDIAVSADKITNKGEGTESTYNRSDLTITGKFDIM